MTIQSPPLPAVVLAARRRLLPHGHPVLVLTLILTCQLMVILDATIVNIALPDIKHALHVSTANLSWGGQRLHPHLRWAAAGGPGR